MTELKNVSNMFTVCQIAVGGLDNNFSYLVYENQSRSAVLIDPCGDTDVIRNEVRTAGSLRPEYILLTHGHGDHTSGVLSARKFFDCPTGAHPSCAYPHEVSIGDRQKIPLGIGYLECIYTPGHTKDSVIYKLSDDSAIFTGDTLFVGCCGYCDSRAMFSTMRNVIYPLADSNIVFSGHDYGDLPFDTLGNQKKSNPYLRIDEYNEFCKELRNL